MSMLGGKALSLVDDLLEVAAPEEILDSLIIAMPEDEAVEYLQKVIELLDLQEFKTLN